MALETAVAQARALTFEMGSTTAFLKEEFQAGGGGAFVLVCSFVGLLRLVPFSFSFFFFF